MTNIQMLKAIIAVVMIAFVFIYWRIDGGKMKPRKAYTIALWMAAALSVVSYFDFGYYPKHGRFMNPHGWFHYYLGSKYAKEVGYYDFYRAVVVANKENNGRPMQNRLRNQNDYKTESVKTVLRNADQYKSLFTEERWKEFRGDVAYFQSIFIPRRWPGVVNDKGYNATPTWSMIGSFLSNTIPTSSRMGMFLLLCLDLILVGVMLCFMHKAFGFRPMMITLVYVCTHFAFFMYNVNEIRGAFLRLDWVTLAVMSACLLKLGRFKTAGGLLAYAGMARIFPLVLVFGPAAKCAWDFIETRKLNRQYVGFFATFAAVSVVLVGGSLLWGGSGLWHDFLEKIRMHNEGLSSQRSGFKYAFLSFWPWTQKDEAFAQWRFVWLGIQIAVLAGCFWLTRRLDDREALAFSYVPMFFLTAPTTYYHIGLVILLALFLSKMAEWPRALGVALMFALTACFCIFNNVEFSGGLPEKSATMSWVLFGVVAYAVFAAAMDGRAKRLAAPTS